MFAVIAAMSCSSSNGGGSGEPPPSAFGPLGDRADLQVDERLRLDHLSAPVDVVRDTYGRPHIYAATLPDAMHAQGYVLARDRAVQLEVLRRTAEGRMAELFGDVAPDLIDRDISFRQLGLARTAKAQYASLGAGEVRSVLEAYAEGITEIFRAIRGGQIPLPESLQSFPADAFTDWTAVDSLAIARLQAFLLSYDADQDIARQALLRGLQTTFTASAKDPALQKRTGIERDLWWFAPLDPIAEKPAAPKSFTVPRAVSRAIPQAILATTRTPHTSAAEAVSAASAHARGFLDAVGAVRAQWASVGFGSNAWAITPSSSATGHALLASDPHLDLAAPSALWPVSISVGLGSVGVGTEGALSWSGAALPGIPGILLGHNGKVAWGATVAGYDVSDAYQETVSADGQGVAFGNAGNTGNAGNINVPFETVDEVIAIHGGASFTYHVKIVAHHGPILPTIEGHRVIDPAPGPALSVRWTGSDPAMDLVPILALARARTADEALSALAPYSAGAQNWIIADTSGNIAWTSAAYIPLRKRTAFAWDPSTYTGTLPCLVLPGDGSAEWTGKLNPAFIPAAKNPPSSYLISANNDPTGDLADNNPSNATLPDGTPMYWGCNFDVGFRAARIRTRLESEHRPKTVDDFASMQADVRSALGVQLVPVLTAALDRAQKQRTQPDPNSDLARVVQDPAYNPARIDEVRKLLAAWGTEADFQAASGIDPATNQPLPDAGASPEAVQGRASKATLIFNLWLRNVIIRTLRDEVVAASVSMEHNVLLKAIVHLLTDDPQRLATYDAKQHDSVLWDDLRTSDVLESRDDRIVQAMLDSFVWLDQNAGTDARRTRWGAHHTVRMESLVAPLGTSIPPAADPTFANGFPRSGDEFCVDAAEYSLATAAPSPNFTYAAGPAQRLVVDLDPAGPHAWNAFPSGNVSDPKNAHFRDEAEYWRTNRTHPIPFTVDELVRAKESRTVLVPSSR